MSRNWVLEVEADPSESGSYSIRLGLKDPKTGATLSVASSGASIESFEGELATVKSELDRLLEEARQKADSLQKSGAGAGFDPAEAWGQMEAFASEGDMASYFNSLSESRREQVAEYVFAHVNMFKGRGPVFSERYDSSTHLLD